MNPLLDRRHFLQTTLATGAAAALADRMLAGEAAKATPNVARLGWRVAVCTYTFRQFTFVEAMQKTAELGLKHLEGFTWQSYEPAKRDVKLNETMSDEMRKDLKKRLNDSGMELINCYLQKLPNDEAACRKTFEWGKQVGIQTFVAEPPPEAIDLLAKLCDEYGMNVAIHNHPKPSSRYWNPQTVVDACQGRTRRLGCCADTGHWVRSGIQPVDALKLLEGRVLTFHLKDLTEFGVPKAVDCAWGAGKSDVRGILQEVRRQKIQPVFGMEYERAGEIHADLVASIAFIEKMAAEM